MGRYTDETKSGGGFKPPIGIHNAICCQIVDLGTQETEWEGKVTGKAPMINYSFEFVDITHEKDGEKYHPVWGVREQKSLGKKANMKKFLEGWRGKPFTDEEKKLFDWGKPLGLSCQLVIGPNSKGNPKLTAIARAPAKFNGFRELYSFWFDENFNGELPEWMPEWMQEIIHQSDEWLGLNEQEGGSDDIQIPADSTLGIEEDIPF